MTDKVLCQAFQEDLITHDLTSIIMTDKVLCQAFQEDLITHDFLRVGSNCANSSCCFPITSHPHKPVVSNPGIYHYYHY